MVWRNLTEGQPRNIFTKLFENRPNQFRRRRILIFAMETRILYGSQIFEGILVKSMREDTFCEVSSQLIYWLQRRRCWWKMNAGQKAITILTLSTSCLGELNGPHMYLCYTLSMLKEPKRVISEWNRVSGFHCILLLSLEIICTCQILAHANTLHLQVGL